MSKHWEVPSTGKLEQPRVEFTTEEAIGNRDIDMASGISDDDSNIINTADDIRVDDLLEAVQQKEAPSSEKKPRLSFTGAEVRRLQDLKIREEKIRNAQEGKFNFNNMTEADAYDLDIPIVAKPFSNEDSLDVDLKDKSYVARWVNVNPMRLGSMRARGFIFVIAADLASPLNIEVEVDAQGHYRCNDVVLMRITKERYYGALRAAHMRAISAVSTVGAHKAATAAANQYMEKTAGGEYVDYASKGKVQFYSTGGQ
jgi:hypothetical protein